MATLLAVPPMAGAKDLWSLLALLQDPAAVAARLTALQELETRLNARAAEIGLAEDVDAATIRARADRQQAAEILAAARLEADALRLAALEARDAGVAALAKDRQALVDEREALAQAIRQAESTVKAREADVQRRETAVAQAQARVQALGAEAEALRAEWQARADKLKAAIG
jgi:hypothetical protein